MVGTIAHADVTVRQSGNRVILENDQIRFGYDLSKGTYRATDKRDNLACIKNGVFQIDDLTSNLPKLEHSWQRRNVSGELGRGKSLIIESVTANQETLLFEVTLYDNRPCIVFTGGIENTKKTNPFNSN